MQHLWIKNKNRNILFPNYAWNARERWGESVLLRKTRQIIVSTPIDVVCADHFFQKEIVFLEFKLQNL